MVSRVKFAVHFDGFRIHKLSEALNHVNFVVAQNTIVRLMDAANVGLTAFHQLCPVEVFHIDIKAVIFCIKVHRFCDLRAVPHHLFRYAANVDTSAAEIFGFDESDFRAIHRRAVSGSDTTAATTNAQVVKMCCHYFLQLCLAKMLFALFLYSLYQGEGVTIHPP